MNRDASDFWWLQRRSLLAPRLRLFTPDWQSLPFVQRIPTIEDLTEDRVHVIQMRLLLVQNKELRFVGVWSSICHRESTATIVLVAWMEFVRESHIVAPNRRFFSSHVGRVSSLNHKPSNVAMEYCLVVLPSSSESEEVEGRPRTCVTKYLAFQIPCCRMDGDGHDESDF